MIHNLSLFATILRWWRQDMRLEFQDFEKQFHKWILQLKVSFTFNFHLSNTFSTWNTSLGPFSSQYWVVDVTTLSQNFKFLREHFHKGIVHLKVPFPFDFHLSINIGTWNTNLNLFDPFLGWWKRVETSRFWDSGFRNEHFTLSSPLPLSPSSFFRMIKIFIDK